MGWRVEQNTLFQRQGFVQLLRLASVFEKGTLGCHSYHLASECAFTVIPLPMPQLAVVPRRVTVRIATLNVALPPNRTTPSAPQYTPELRL